MAFSSDRLWWQHVLAAPPVPAASGPLGRNAAPTGAPVLVPCLAVRCAAVAGAYTVLACDSHSPTRLPKPTALRHLCWGWRMQGGAPSRAAKARPAAQAGAGSSSSTLAMLVKALLPILVVLAAVYYMAIQNKQA